MPLRIFISHNVESHGPIARCLVDRLRTLSKGEIECQLCTQTPGGFEWRKWIQSEVSRADLFLYVYTSNCVRQEWLLFEAGVFLGSRQQPTGDQVNEETEEIRSDLICLKSPGIPTPPKPIEHLQAYEADETNLKRFFIDLLVKGQFSAGRPINDELLVEYERGMRDAIKAIGEAFARGSIESVYYRRRLEVGPIDPQAFEELDDGDALEFSPDTPVIVTDLACEMIGLAECEKLTWGQLRRLKESETEQLWIEELQDVARAVFFERAARLILTPFHSTNGRVCNPIVSRIDRVQRNTHKLSVLFVEHERVEEVDEFTDALRRAPESFRTMVRMMGLTRRTRWNVIEPFKSHIGAPEAMRHDTSTIAQEFSDNLERLEREAREAGWLSADMVKAAFDKVMHDEIDELFARYATWRREFSVLLQEPDEERLKDLVDQFSAINKRFWLVVLDRYEELIDRLSPTGLHSAMAYRREMASAEIWKNVLGDWEGVARDVNIPGLLEFTERFEYDVALRLMRHNRGIGGTASLTARDPETRVKRITAKAGLEGIFARGSYCAITYRIADLEARHFGIMLVKIADTMVQLRGLFLSKKAFEEDTLGFGQVVLVRPGSGIEPDFSETPEWLRTDRRPARPQKRARPRRKPAPKKATRKKTASKKA